MVITRFEDIEAWQHARMLCGLIHEVSSDGAWYRDFALRDQINRSSGSIMDNIAEGYDSDTNPEFIRFLSYAQRSCSEVKSQLYRALDRKYIQDDKFNELFNMATETHKLTGGFIKYLKSCQRKR